MTDNKPIRLLYAGTFTDTQGRKHTYTDADLERIATSYDYAANPAPLVVGHPKLDAPAFGWAEKLAVMDGELVAYPDEAKLEPAFAEEVNAGRYARISPSLYAPDDPNNPAPGGWSLKHIGFLGAAAPAVKGLGMVSFAESDSFITLETTDQETTTMADETRAAEFAERETALTTRETQIAERERQLAERETAARHNANVAFAEALVGGGKLAPAGKDLAVIALDGLDGDTAVSFGEANEQITPLAALKKLFEGAGTVVAFGEHARAPADQEAGDKDPQVIADRAVAFAASERDAGRVVTIAAAVRHVMKNQAD